MENFDFNALLGDALPVLPATSLVEQKLSGTPSSMGSAFTFFWEVGSQGGERIREKIGGIDGCGIVWFGPVLLCGVDGE